MPKKRIVNIRILSVIFIGLMFGILFCYNFLLGNLNTLQIVLIICGVLLVSIASWLYGHFTYKKNLLSEYRLKVTRLLKISSVLFVISFVVGIVALLVPISSLLYSKTYSQEVRVSGVVCDYVEDNITYKKFLLKNCVIETEEGKEPTKFKIVVYTDKNAQVNLGDKLSFTGQLKSYNLFRNRDKAMALQGVTYQTYVNFDDMTITAGQKSIKDVVKNNTYNLLINNISKDNANIFYAILFGEKQGLSDNLIDMFSGAGISHILAVSGLHIGVLVSALYFIFKKLKINDIVSLILLGVILLFYSYLCSFTPSVCRASIMAIILSLSRILKRNYDSFNSLSLAGIIILLFNPLGLFSVSFQLSFLCIFAIITLAPSLSELLNKIKCPNFLSSALSISIATNIAIMPICQNVFAKVSLLGILTNILVLPVFSITYVLLFAVVVIGSIIPILAKLLVIPNLFLQLIKTVADYVVSLGFGVFKVFYVSYLMLVAIILFALVLHFLLTKRFVKGGMAVALAILTISLFISSAIPERYDNSNLIFASKYNKNTCFYIEDNYVTLIGSNVKSSTILNELKNLKIRKINAIVAYDLQLNDLENLQTICMDNFVDTIYLPKQFEFDELSNKFNNVIFFEDNVTIGNLDLKTIHYLDSIIGVTFNCKFGRVLIPEIKPTKKESSFLFDNYRDIDILYLNNETTNIDPDDFHPKIVIYNNGNSTMYDESIGQVDIYIIANGKTGVRKI